METAFSKSVVLDDHAMEDRKDHSGRLVDALTAEGAYGRTVRRRAAATVGLILLFLAVLAVTGLYLVALSGLALLACSIFGIVLVLVVHPRRASLILRARTASVAARRSLARASAQLRPFVGRSTRECSALVRRLRQRLPEGQAAASRALSLGARAFRAVRALELHVRIANAVEETGARIRASERALRAVRTTTALLANERQASEGARVREALRLNIAGAKLRRAGAFAEAAERHRQALDVFDDLGDRRAAALTKSNLALALDRAGDDAALELLEEAATTLGDLGDEQSEGQVIANLAVALRRRGQAERADDALARALDKLEEDSPQYHQVDSLRRAS
jgi:tetratricopeptide (TPR) repeat protein